MEEKWRKLLYQMCCCISFYMPVALKMSDLYSIVKQESVARINPKFVSMVTKREATTSSWIKMADLTGPVYYLQQRMK